MTAVENEPEPLAVSVRAAARRLGAGRDATYQLVRNGRLRTIVIGGRRLVPVVELAAFVTRELEEESHRDGGTPPTRTSREGVPP